MEKDREAFELQSNSLGAKTLKLALGMVGDVFDFIAISSSQALSQPCADFVCQPHQQHEDDQHAAHLRTVEHFHG